MTEANAHLDERLKLLLESWFAVDPGNAESLKAQNRHWFASTPEQDHELAGRFGELARAAAEGQLDEYAALPHGRLALIILLDQFPRNLYRGTKEAFAHDAKALELCIGGLENDMVETLEPLERVFFCMPLQHAESREIQMLSVETFATLAAISASADLSAALGGFADYARMHRDIVDRFGRFPHRNQVLERESTAEEREFLDSGGPSFGQ